jgi:hypothetical protein
MRQSGRGHLAGEAVVDMLVVRALVRHRWRRTLQSYPAWCDLERIVLERRHQWLHLLHLASGEKSYETGSIAPAG